MPWDGCIGFRCPKVAGVARAKSTLDDISSVEDPDLATRAGALRAMRNLVAQGTTSSGADS